MAARAGTESTKSTRRGGKKGLYAIPIVIVPLVGAILTGLVQAPAVTDWFVQTFSWKPFGPFVILKANDEPLVQRGGTFRR
jgi:hypothetical protein